MPGADSGQGATGVDGDDAFDLALQQAAAHADVDSRAG